MTCFRPITRKCKTLGVELHGEESSVTFSRYITVELDSEGSISCQLAHKIWILKSFSTCANLECTCTFVSIRSIKFSAYGHEQTYTRVLQCSFASVGLTQAHLNYSSCQSMRSFSGTFQKYLIKCFNHTICNLHHSLMMKITNNLATLGNLTKV